MSGLSGAVLIAVMALFTASLTFTAWRKWRQWEMLNMCLGSIAIAFFYIGRVIDTAFHNNAHMSSFIFWSRLLWIFVLVNTALMAVAELQVRKEVDE